MGNMKLFVGAIFAFVFVVMIGIFSFYGYVGYQIASDPDGTGKAIGSFVGSVVDGAKGGSENE